MRHRSVLYVLLAGVVVLVALFGAITVSRLSLYSSALSQGPSSLMATPIHHYGAEAGPSTCHQGLGYRTLVWQLSPASGD